MNDIKLSKLLKKFKENKISEDELIDFINKFPVQNLNFAKIDNHRTIRNGFPEVIYCKGKTPLQVKQIAKKILSHNKILLATKAERKHFVELKKEIPNANFYPNSNVITVNEPKKNKSKNYILIISAGTSDIPVAEEAMLTIKMIGHNVKTIYDIGVAGIHRMFSHIDEIQSAKVIIVVAGMDGALPSVIGGLVKVPVIAVPTSTGYGANFDGLAPLLTMLNSCSAGVSVVNINNGFGAGFCAGTILSNIEKGNKWKKIYLK